MTPAFQAPAWLVGCGNMVGAIVEGWRVGGADFAGVTVIRPSGTSVEGIRTVTDYPDEQPRFVMLGFKPQKLDEIAPGLAPHVGDETILVSMMAGVTAAALRERFARAKAIVRIMPNLPVAQLQGVTAIYSADGGESELHEIGQIFAGLGMLCWCKSEEELGIVGAMASAAIAYVARFAEALGTAGAALGIQPELAALIAEQTLVGTGAYAASGVRLPEIARRVASPRGTTEQGLAVLDAPDGLQQLVDRTLAAAIRRGKELAEEAASRN